MPKISKIEASKTSVKTLHKGYNATFPALLVWARHTFTSAIHSFFLANLVLEGTKSILETILLAMSANKNLDTTAEVVFNWLKVGLLAFMIFILAPLGAAANIAVLGLALALDPFVHLVQTVGFFALMVTSNDLEEKEEYYNKVKEHVGNAVLAGLAGLSIAALFLVPGLNVAAAVTLAVVGTIAVAIPLTVIVTDAARRYVPRIWKKITAIWKSPEDESLKKERKPIIQQISDIQLDKRSRFFSIENRLKYANAAPPQPVAEPKSGYFKNITVYKFDSYQFLSNDIERHKDGLKEKVKQTSFADSLVLQTHKRTNKAIALTILQNVLNQWNQLIHIELEQLNAESGIKYQIHLEGDNYISLTATDINGKFDVDANREKVIKLISQYVTKNYPGVFQSFAKYKKGDTEVLFERVFEWVRQNKTNDEMNDQYNNIFNKIQNFERTRLSLWERTKRLDISNQNIGNSIHALNNFLAAVINKTPYMDCGTKRINLPHMYDKNDYNRFRNEFLTNSNMQDSFAAQGVRASIFTDICNLLHSKQLAEICKESPAPVIYTAPQLDH